MTRSAGTSVSGHDLTHTDWHSQRCLIVERETRQGDYDANQGLSHTLS